MTGTAAMDSKKDRTLTYSSIVSVGLHAAVLFLLSLVLIHRPSLMPGPIEVTLLSASEGLPQRGLPSAWKQGPPVSSGKGRNETAKPGRVKEKTAARGELPAAGRGTEDIGPARNELERRRTAEEERLSRLSAMRKDTGEERGVGRDKGPGGGGTLGKDAGVSEGPAGRRLVLERVLPGYPRWAREKGIETEAGLKFWVTSEGKVRDVEVIRFSGIPEFDQLAENALLKWRFEPLRREEAGRDEWGVVSMLWRLED